MLRDLLEILFKDKSSFRFIIGTIFGLSFSMSIILSTIGIMDGFDIALKQSLKLSEGDFYIYSKDGFFEFDSKLQEKIESLDIDLYSPVIKTQGFFIKDETSKGVIVRGIETESYNQVTGMKFNFNPTEVAVGEVLAKRLSLKIGDRVVLAFANGNGIVKGMPVLEAFFVGQIVKHGVYEKDFRQVYVDKNSLAKMLGWGSKVNVANLKIDKSLNKISKEYIEKIKRVSREFSLVTGNDFKATPFWYDFSGIIEAVKYEKGIISLVLQIVVIVSIFNVLAFVIFINERKSQEIFLLIALGLSQKKILLVWPIFFLILWVFSCFGSMIFVSIFDFSLKNLSFFQLPGEIYNISSLSITPSFTDYMTVFSLVLAWLLILSWVMVRRRRNKTVVEGLRREFS